MLKQVSSSTKLCCPPNLVINLNKMLTQEKIYGSLMARRPAYGKELYGKDLGHLWDLAGEIAHSKSHRLREIAEGLINDTILI